MNDELDVENGEIMISIPATADVAVGAQSTSRSGMPDYSPHKKACHSYAVPARRFVRGEGGGCLDYELVWDVVWKKIPRLRKEVQEILKKENTG